MLFYLTGRTGSVEILGNMAHIGVADFKVGNGIHAVYSNGESGRLALDLKDARGDIILTFHVRFEEKVVILNSTINGSEGKEERPTGYNFEPLRKTTVDFVAKEEHIQVLVDGISFYEYKHRLPISSLSKVQFWSSDHSSILHFLGVKFSEVTQRPPSKQYIGISQ